MPAAGPSSGGESWYSYAIVRVVPRVERGESLNVGIILFSRTRHFLEARIEVDEKRLLALASGADLAQLEAHLATFRAIAAGDEAGGSIARLGQSERFHWLTSPRSTIIQTSEVHTGRCDDPERLIEDLMERLVR